MGSGTVGFDRRMSWHWSITGVQPGITPKRATATKPHSVMPVVIQMHLRSYPLLRPGFRPRVDILAAQGFCIDPCLRAQSQPHAQRHQTSNAFLLNHDPRARSAVNHRPMLAQRARGLVRQRGQLTEAASNGKSLSRKCFASHALTTAAKITRSVSDKDAGVCKRDGSAMTADRAAADIRGISINPAELKRKIGLILTFFDR